MYLGRAHLGDTICLPLVAQTAAGVPTIPDAPPSFIVYDTANVVQANGLLTMVDRYGTGQTTGGQVVGFFLFELFIGSEFAAGQYRVLVNWQITDPFADTLTFEVATAGDKDGPGFGLGVFSLPNIDNVLMPCASGRIKKFRNPRAL